MGNPFTEATTPRRVEASRYVADLDEAWNLRPLPQGGVVTALAVRAMAAALANDEQQPRTLHTTFAAQVAHGPLEVDVEVFRAGRSMSQARAEVRSRRAPAGRVRVVARPAARRRRGVRPDGVLGRDHRGPDHSRARAVGAVRPRPRRAGAVVPLRRAAAARRRPPRPVGAHRARRTMPGAVGEKLGPSERTWFAPSVDLTVHLLDDCRSPWVLAHNRARHAGDGYASVEMALWDPADGAPRLVTYATQLCLFTFLGEEAAS